MIFSLIDISGRLMAISAAIRARSVTRRPKTHAPIAARRTPSSSTKGCAATASVTALR